jgi:hypothetical protein
MTQAVSSAGFFHDLFAPLPEQERRPKDLVDHAADYAETSEGAWDFFRCGYHTLAAIESTFAAPPAFIAKVKGVFDSAGVAISIPRALSNINSLKNSMAQLLAAQNLPYTDSLRDRKIVQAGKAGIVDSLALTNTLAQIGLFLQNATILFFDAFQLSVVDGIYNVTGGVLDGIELIGEGFKLQQYQAPEAQPRNQKEATKLEEKKNLAWMIIIKDIASIAMAVIALSPVSQALGLTFIVFPAVAPAALLAISAFWLAMKITSYFYSKLVVDAPVTT